MTFRATAILFLTMSCFGQGGGWLPSRIVSVDYPLLALQSRTTGTVTIRCVVELDGLVSSCSLLSGNPVFSGSIFASVRGWKFSPRLPADPKSSSDVTLTFEFRIEEPPKARPQTTFVFLYPYNAEVVGHAVLRSH